MRQTTENPKRIPRKLKKEVIKVFQLKAYQNIMHRSVTVKAHLLCYLEPTGTWKYKFKGYTLYYKLS